MNTRQLCTFKLDDLLFGIDVVDVQEVIRYQEMTRVPLASTVVHGLINLRGQIVTALDMRARLGLPARRADLLPMNVVVRADEGAVSLLVDEIGEVVEVGEQIFERAPETMTSSFRALVPGVYKLESTLLLVLDVESVTTLSRTKGEAA